MTNEDKVDKIFLDFQKWLDKHNNRCHRILIEHKGFLDPQEEFGILREGQKELPNQHIPYPIQQVEKEIKEFLLELCKNLTIFDNALEIGMGEFGGTHTLFNLLFNTTTTIEVQSVIVNNFVNNNNLTDKDIIINGSSNQAYNHPKIHTKIFDMLFIDGDHQYEQTKMDYYNYSKYVKNGGIIAFHDANNPKYGVKKFLSELKSGLIDGKNHIINEIFYSFETGIGYIIK